VHRARTAISRAIGQPVKLVGDEGEDIVRPAVYALYEIGPLALGPLATALKKEPNPRIRSAMMCVLRMCSREARSDVLTALLEISHRDPERTVRQAAWAAHAQLTADIMPPAKTVRSRATNATSTNADRSDESTTGGAISTAPTA